MPEIVVKFNEKVIERVVTEKKRISVGRTKDNDIVLENRGVSRKHAQIEFSGEKALIIDNESLNGVFVNNRRIAEEVLRDKDVITIGKYKLEFVEDSDQQDIAGQMDGTMILNTKQQKKMMSEDKKDRNLVSRIGGTALIGLENSGVAEFRIDREVTTIGKAKFVHLRAKGFLLSGIQAKIVKEGKEYYIINLGRKGKTKVNGETVTRIVLKNSDIIQVGKTIFRFVEDK
ncbi:MAG: FHA domain-containing protein [candidate division Zixibacteria bacterium]|nr:FHA domain-containing protein [candidate division Zixibacteria bacterium]